MSISSFSPDTNIMPSLEVEKRNYRLDPSQYNKRGESMVAHLRGLGLPFSKIADLEGFREVYLPKRFSRIYLDDVQEGVPLLGTSTMLLARLPEDTRIRLTDGLSTLGIRAGDILISGVVPGFVEI
ncbi:MAG TPA: hypothetical protein GX517_05745 [Alicyclobacillus sp.]|nr:hypothetical protein [Alicyclobacillus sp.]